MTSKYTTRIPAHGNAGNIYSIIGAARELMRQLNEPQREIEGLTFRVQHATTYAEALAAVREWFPVDTDN